MTIKNEVFDVAASTVEAVRGADVAEVLLLCQYLLTAYLTTVPSVADGEMKVLELVHDLLLRSDDGE